jgi:hypothetical protein
MIDARKWIWIPLVTFALGMVLGVAGSKCDFTPDPKPPVVVVEPVKPDRVVYVYEKDDTAVPSEVMVVDGNGEVPDQYKVAIDAARLAGLPAFVLLSKGKFVDYADLAKLETIVKDAK